MRICICGQAVGDIRLKDGSRQAVEPWPIPYRLSEYGGRPLFILDGQMVQGMSCRPDDKQGIGYPGHNCPRARHD